MSSSKNTLANIVLGGDLETTTDDPDEVLDDLCFEFLILLADEGTNVEELMPDDALGLLHFEEVRSYLLECVYEPGMNVNLWGASHEALNRPDVVENVRRLRNLCHCEEPMTSSAARQILTTDMDTHRDLFLAEPGEGFKKAIDAMTALGINGLADLGDED